MPRLDPKTWEIIRAKRESGATLGDLAREFGVAKSAISQRASKEGWADVTKAIHRRALEKMVMAVAPGLSRDEAIEASAEAAAEVIRTHRSEINAIRERLFYALERHRAAVGIEAKREAFEDLKAAKIASETMINIHKAEREAWNLDNSQSTEIVIRNPRSWEVDDPEPIPGELN